MKPGPDAILDRNDPLCPDAFCVPLLETGGRRTKEHVTGLWSTAYGSALTHVNSPYGVAVNFPQDTTNGYIEFANFPAIAASNPSNGFTYFIIFSTVNAGTANFGSMFEAPQSGGSADMLQMAWNAGITSLTVGGSNGSSGPVAVTANTWYALSALSIFSSSQFLLGMTLTGATASGGASTNPSNFRIGFGSFGTAFNGPIATLYGYRRILSMKDRFELLDDPYRMLKVYSALRRYWQGANTAVASITASISISAGSAQNVVSATHSHSSATTIAGSGATASIGATEQISGAIAATAGNGTLAVGNGETYSAAIAALAGNAIVATANGETYSGTTAISAGNASNAESGTSGYSGAVSSNPSGAALNATAASQYTASVGISPSGATLAISTGSTVSASVAVNAGNAQLTGAAQEAITAAINAVASGASVNVAVTALFGIIASIAVNASTAGLGANTVEVVSTSIAVTAGNSALQIAATTNLGITATLTINASSAQAGVTATALLALVASLAINAGSSTVQAAGGYPTALVDGTGHHSSLLPTQAAQTSLQMKYPLFSGLYKVTATVEA